MTEYRGSATFVAHCQHCKLKTLLNNTIDPSLRRRVVQTGCIRIHSAPGYVENYCNGMNVSFQGPIGKILRRTGKCQDKQFTEMLSRNLPFNLFYFLYFLVTTRVSNGMSNV